MQTNKIFYILISLMSVGLVVGIVFAIIFTFVGDDSIETSTDDSLSTYDYSEIAQSDTDSDNVDASSTGGTGYHSDKTLVLSGWDEENTQGTPLAKLINTDYQNLILESILSDYIENYDAVFYDNMIGGSISNLSYNSAATTQKFDITVSDVVYNVEFNIVSYSLSIKESSTGRVVY